MIERTESLTRLIVAWRAAALAALLSVALAGVLTQALAGSHAGAPAAGGAAVHGGLAILPIAAQGEISAALGAASSAYRPTHAGSGSLRAANPAQRIAATFTASGVHVRSGTLRLNLSLGALGHGAALVPLAPAVPQLENNRVIYSRQGLSEWYANGPLGVEQGFTLTSAPAPRTSGPLTLAIDVNGNAPAALVSGGARVLFKGTDGRRLTYGALVASDAGGRTLHSWLALSGGKLLLRVADAGAAYPITIDPLIAEQELTGGPEENELRGEQVVAHGALGASVSMSADGNTALVGAPSDGHMAGAVWVFVRTNGVWSQQGPKLTAPEPVAAGEACGPGEAEDCAFGRSVALSSDGTTALIGAPRQAGPCQIGEETTTCPNRGAAWVYTRVEGAGGPEWKVQSMLTGGPEEGREGRFGRGVALSGDGSTAVVGASSNAAGHGAAWAFTRSGTTWSHQGPMLTTGEEGAGESHLGASAALSEDGSTAVVGAPADNGYAGAAWVYTRTGGVWSQQGPKLSGGAEEGGEGHLGVSVALAADGSTALLGARRDTAVVEGATVPGYGAAWVFARSGGVWSQQGPKLTGGEEELGGGEFGAGVALSSDGSTALVGAPRDASSVGAAWLFSRTGASWTRQTPKLRSDGALAKTPSKGWFGTSVALRADAATALVGAPNEHAMAGSVWAFVDSATLPTPTSISPDAGPTGGGTSVRIDGSRLAGATKVEFGPNSASFRENPDGSLTAVAPAWLASSVCVRVTTAAGRSPESTCPTFRYLPAPVLRSVSPAEGPATGGTSVTIEGANFTEVSSVSFGSTPATSFTVSSTGSLTAVTPAEAEGEVRVTVTTPGGTSNARSFVFAGGGSVSKPPPGTKPTPKGEVLGLGPIVVVGGTVAGAGGGAVTGVITGCGVSLASGRIAVLSHARAAVKLTWAGTGTCRGRLTLKVRSRVGKRLKLRTIGAVSFAIAPGATRTVTLKLNRTGRALLRAGHGRLRATLLIASATQASSANVRLVVQRPRRAAKH